MAADRRSWAPSQLIDDLLRRLFLTALMSAQIFHTDVAGELLGELQAMATEHLLASERSEF